MTGRPEIDEDNVILLIAAVYRRALLDARRDPEAAEFLTGAIPDWRSRLAGKHSILEKRIDNDKGVF